MDKVLSVGVIGLVILFQDDIRKFLFNLGERQRMRALRRFFTNGDKKLDKVHLKQAIMPVVLACMSMSKKRVGALIVIQRATPLDDIVSTGEIINADINQRLIENLFFKNSKELGLRHRAALGITHESDCVAIVVSEETGSISIAIHSKFHLRLSAEKLESILTQELA